MGIVSGVMGLNFLVNWLLLMGASRLCGYPPGPGRCALGGAVGGLYGGLCMVPGFRFLGGTLWRTVILASLALLAYGLQKSTLRRGSLFVLLSLVLGIFWAGLRGTGRSGIAVGLGLLCLLWAVLFYNRRGPGRYLPVEVRYGGRHLKLRALRDTGNTLRDPVTGSPVLVLDGETAGQLTGLTPQQLRSPVETMGALPGLRLIPYRAVGTPGGLLLAMKLPQVKIGSWQGSLTVAFAPDRLHSDGKFQALAGGMV